VEGARRQLIDHFGAESLSEEGDTELRNKLGRFERYRQHFDLIEAVQVQRRASTCKICLLATERRPQKASWRPWAPRYVSVTVGAFYELRTDLDRWAARPERFTDKFQEFLRPREVDFDRHPEFSRKYYVLATSPERLFVDVGGQVWNFVARYDGLCLEGYRDTLFVDWPTAVDQEPTTIRSACECFLALGSGLGLKRALRSSTHR
jgi:hypothetical protein